MHSNTNYVLFLTGANSRVQEKKQESQLISGAERNATTPRAYVVHNACFQDVYARPCIYSYERVERNNNTNKKPNNLGNITLLL